MTENLSKSRQWFAEPRFWYQVAVVFLIAVIIFVWLYFKYGPVRRLEAENESLSGKIVELKSRNEELHEENLQNLHYKNLLDPIRRKAKELYPELETNAAVAMLAEDVKAVQEPGTRDRELATRDREPAPRDMYKPLSPDVRQRIISELEGIIANYRGAGPKVKITFDAGSLARLKVAESLYGIFKEAGYRVGEELTITFSRHSPGVSTFFNPEDSEAAYRIGTAIYGFINNQFLGIQQAERLRATYEIIIAGEPMFSDDGIVTLR
jgi:hypothetical protein